MASLALAVSIIVLFIVLSGPVVLFLSKIQSISNTVIYVLATMSIVAGLWFFSLPIPAIRYAGLFSVVLGGLAIRERTQKKI